MWEIRKNIAENLFLNYDFEPDQVKDVSCWQEDGDKLSCSVFLERGDEPSERVTFTVKFAHGTTTVVFAGVTS